MPLNRTRSCRVRLRSQGLGSSRISMTSLPDRRGRSQHTVVITLGVLTFAFFLRVIGQAVQAWAPQSFLPPFDAFQGSSLPYGVLLLTQLSILAAMVVVTARIYRCTLMPQRRTGAVLAWLGGAYLSVSIARILIGVFMAAAPAWFRTWLPATFHLVLAAFVLTLAYFHHTPRHGELN
jgi:hypothetical protein